jgi:hypothetical protein
MHFHCTDVNDAFLRLVKAFADPMFQVRRSSSRVGDVLLIDEPVIITYKRPLQRVLFNPWRDCNPFFHLFESLWMLAGRNDVAPLAYFNSKISDIASDDGQTFNGAYGYRWRHTETHYEGSGYDGGIVSTPIDQLAIIIDQLKQKPDSRRRRPSED